MESVVLEDSPLAAYLEGRGVAEALTSSSSSSSSSSLEGEDRDDLRVTRTTVLNDSYKKNTTPLIDTALSFAPRPLSNFISILPRPRPSVLAHAGLLTRIKTGYALAVTSTLGRADNERFLEHFRYILIASQLLNEHFGPAGYARPHQDQYSPFDRDGSSHSLSTTSFSGAIKSAGAAFVLVWLLHWARGDQQQPGGGGGGGLKKRRIALVLLVLAAAGVVLYAYVRRQWLQYLRSQAIETSSTFVNSVQAFETSANSVITLIQEVELVSRGYRISHPLPPITRLEGKGQNRRCARLRRNLQGIYSTAIPLFTAATDKLASVRNQDDFERFLDVYDIQNADIQEAALGYTELEAEEVEALRQIRVHQFRLGTLRRILCCSLLSVPATGRKSDAVRWKTVNQEMDHVSKVLDQLADSISQLLNDEEKLPLSAINTRLETPNTSRPTSHPGSSGMPLSPVNANSSASTGLKSQLFRINSLSSNIRSLQAKLYLLHEDSTRALASSTSEADMARLSASFQEQYTAIGADLSDLAQIWEAGQAALKDDILRHERRLSQSSPADSTGSGFRRSSSSLGGLTVVEEDAGSSLGVVVNGSGSGAMSPRSAALYALSGIPHPARPASGDMLQLLDSSASPTKGAGVDYQVYEAVAAQQQPPRPRSTLTREQRIARQHEERERSAAAKEKRDANTNMIKELRAVINLRPESVRLERERSRQQSLSRRRSSGAASTASNASNASSTSLSSSAAAAGAAIALQLPVSIPRSVST